ncbi:50S ribosomal protein L6 [Candidatus Pacearchaeota archaeon]|nr:50S ribosomal protein L6 [Candidatus Pacearchaeota archaeon]
MKKKLLEKIKIPSGVSCTLSGGVLSCTKDGNSISRSVVFPGITVELSGDEIIFASKRGSKKDLKVIKSYGAHLANMFHGLKTEFIYTLEACNVHFPMTLKVDKDTLVINNFLGEKTPRKAKILPTVKAEIKGQKITLSSYNKEAAGQTAANIEKATKIRNRDRRIFQDGIYLIERPGRTV